MLEVGTKAPDFELLDQNGQLHKLQSHHLSPLENYSKTPNSTASLFSEAVPNLL